MTYAWYKLTNDQTNKKKTILSLEVIHQAKFAYTEKVQVIFGELVKNPDIINNCMLKKKMCQNSIKFLFFITDFVFSSIKTSFNFKHDCFSTFLKLKIYTDLE